MVHPEEGDNCKVKEIQLQEIRKALREKGFRVQTTRMSFGRSAVLVDEDGEKCTGNVFTTDTLSKWEPAFAVLRELLDEGDKVVDDGERVYGLSPYA